MCGSSVAGETFKVSRLQSSATGSSPSCINGMTLVGHVSAEKPTLVALLEKTFVQESLDQKEVGDAPVVDEHRVPPFLLLGKRLLELATLRAHAEDVLSEYEIR